MSQIRREEYVNTGGEVTRGEHVQTVADPYETRRRAAWRLQQILYTILLVIEGLLLIRFVLKLLAANPGAGFSSLVYSVTEPLVQPFFGLFGTPAGANGTVLELNTIIALIVYPLIFWVLGRLVSLLFTDNRSGVVARRVDTYAQTPVRGGETVVREERTDVTPVRRAETVVREERTDVTPPPPPPDV